MTAMVSIDSNVFIYFLEEHPDFFQAAASAIFGPLSAGEIINVPTLALTEILSGSSNQKNIDLFAMKQFKLHVLSEEIAILAGQLRQKHTSLKTADAIFIATALISGSKRFITHDTRLARLSVGIEFVLLETFKEPSSS